MSLPVASFANLAAGNQPLSLLDQQFTAVAATGVLPCGATGTNTLVLTPLPNVYVPTSYVVGTKFSWVQPITTVAGAVTINAAGLGAITAYRANGQVALGAGDLVGGCVYTATFSNALGSGSGGFAVDALPSAGPPGPVGPSGPAGATGPAGPAGPPGSGTGIPVGGATGTVLTKNSPTDYDVSWQSVAGVGVTSWNTRTGAVTLTLTDVTNVGGAPLASPALSGTPTAPTASAGTNNTQVATTQFVAAAVAAGGSGGGTALQGAFKNLLISVPSVTTVTVTADAVITYDGTNWHNISAINSTINAATVGANGLDAGAMAQATWYSVWVISGTGGQAGLLSLSPTSPAMPAGYTAKARVGWVRTQPASANLLNSRQAGRSFQYVLTGTAPQNNYPVISSGVQGTISDSVFTPVAVPVASFAPSTAYAIRAFMYSSGAPASQGFAPNPNFNGVAAGTVTPPMPPLNMRGGSSGYSMPATWIMLEGSNVYYASASATGTVVCMGYDDNL